jgi:hypothetical protein
MPVSQMVSEFESLAHRHTEKREIVGMADMLEQVAGDGIDERRSRYRTMLTGGFE